MLFLLLACIDLDLATGCDFRDGSVNGPEPRCQERTGAQSAGFDAMCESLGGTAVDGGCPTDGIVAGCDLSVAGTAGEIFDWYYAPETAETVAVTCDEDGAPVVEP
jgi:hypothetical protein